MSGGNRGFTLVEALVAAVLVAVGIAGAVGGFGALTRAQAILQEKESMQRLAVAKYEEVVAMGSDQASSEGDFEEWNEPRYAWEVQIEPTGTENLDFVRVTVRALTGSTAQTSVEGLVYTPPPPPAEEEGGTQP